jgi:hypothetical protein
MVAAPSTKEQTIVDLKMLVVIPSPAGLDPAEGDWTREMSVYRNGHSSNYRGFSTETGGSNQSTSTGNNRTGPRILFQAESFDGNATCDSWHTEDTSQQSKGVRIETEQGHSKEPPAPAGKTQYKPRAENNYRYCK